MKQTISFSLALALSLMSLTALAVEDSTPPSEPVAVSHTVSNVNAELPPEPVRHDKRDWLQNAVYEVKSKQIVFAGDCGPTTFDVSSADFFDAETGKSVPNGINTIKAGDIVQIYYDPASRINRIPESERELSSRTDDFYVASTVILNIGQEDSGQYMVAYEVKKTNTGFMLYSDAYHVSLDTTCDIRDADGHKLLPDDLLALKGDLPVILWFDGPVLETYPASGHTKRIVLTNTSITASGSQSETTAKEITIKNLEVTRGNEKLCTLTSKMAPYTTNGVQMIPVTRIAKACGYSVTLDNKTKTATLVKGKTKATFKWGSNKYTWSGKSNKLSKGTFAVKNQNLFAPASFMKSLTGLPFRVSK